LAKVTISIANLQGEDKDAWKYYLKREQKAVLKKLFHLAILPSRRL
jgi:hypothetical protein